MIYYDIHTHREPQDPNIKAVISIDIRQPFTPIPNELYAVGIHPWYADRKHFQTLEQYASHPQIALIGEAGLDKLVQTPFDMQKELFKAQVQLSENVQKPLIIHCVKAWEELLKVRKETRPLMPWIIHGFRGKRELAEQLLNADLYLSFGTFHHTDALHAAWDKQHLLIETDDKPVDIRIIYRQIAEGLHLSEKTLVQTIEKRFSSIIYSR